MGGFGEKVLVAKPGWGDTWVGSHELGEILERGPGAAVGRRLPWGRNGERGLRTQVPGFF